MPYRPSEISGPNSPRQDTRESAEQWRSRAQEARTIALLMSDLFARQTMITIATGYDNLADWADKHHHPGINPEPPSDTRLK